MKSILLVLSAFYLGSSSHLYADDLTQAQAEELFVGKVLPLLKTKCFACHGEDPKGNLKGDLDMRTRAAMLKGGESEEPSLVPGKPTESLLIQAIRWEGYEMPPKENDRLSETEIGSFEKWVAANAPWPDEKRMAEIQAKLWYAADGVIVKTSGGESADWTNRRYEPADLWAYRPIQHPPVPKNSLSKSSNSIDAFINRKLDGAGIVPVPAADKLTLIRRVTFDLTGLPPTPQEVQDFLDDDSPASYETLVERLLASPRYGEQMARHWLDVVRYADTAGFSNDFERPNAWRYRDYVIKSFNDDKPYDQFIHEQIAGDEIDATDPTNLIATGYLRMGPWEHTGMSVMAVTRQQFLDDVVNSVGETFLGTTLRCFKCHDHKFDPMPTLDYYRMQAIFAPVQFAERDAPFQEWENTTHLEEEKSRILKLIDDPGISLQIHEGATEKEREDALKGVNKVQRKQTEIRTRQQYRYDPLAFSVYNGPIDKSYRSNKPLHPMQKKMKGDLQQVFVLKAGSVETPGEAVTPGILSAVPLDAPQSPAKSFGAIPETREGRRVALARWITSAENPLTARVMVNRIWQWHFGNAIAGNPNNFGKTGKKPTHPELLDFLATEFVKSGWSIKAMHRQILLSEAYRRSGTPTDPEQVAKLDPGNELLSWFPPRRLSGEELRDSLLAISGELNLEMGGAPIRPAINQEVAFQPRHVMGSVAPAYQPSRTPEKRNRRTIYALKIRTLRDPLLEVFDQPNADNSCERRTESTVTPQVFGLFNSQNTYDRALSMANRVVEQNDSTSDRIAQMFQLAYGRKATPAERAVCLKHIEQMTAQHQQTKPARVEPPQSIVREMVEEMTGITFQWKEQLDLSENYISDLQAADATSEVRAWAELALVIMNSNEFVYVY